MNTILVTGAAGFIGFHLCENLVNEGYEVIGLDNINDYYDVNLKYARLFELGIDRKAAEINGRFSESNKFGSKFRFIRLSLESPDLFKVFEENNIDVVFNLGAQAGVRYSLKEPMEYVNSNLVGFLNILECCRNYKIKHLLYASSSSVYGENRKIPFSTEDNVDHPISLYAATKKSNELMAYTYSHLYNIPTSGLRFFTVYGPWGRPDMAIFLFTKAISKGEPIKVFNHGEMMRDFTYIDDIIAGLKIVMENSPETKRKPPYQLFNIGKGSPESLKDFIRAIEYSLGKKADRKYLPMQPGDVPQTWADISELEKLGYRSTTTIEVGVPKFVKWYKSFYLKGN